MSCSTSPIDRLAADLAQRVRELERGLADYRGLSGIVTPADESVVPLLSITQSVSGPQMRFTLVWSSEPGQQFAVQESTELPDWTDLESPVVAPEGSTTTWTSGPYTIDETPVWFRVRRFPTLTFPCASPYSCPA